VKDILFIIPQLAHGGSEQLVLNIAKSVKHKGHNCSVLYFNYYGDDFFKSLFENEDINLYLVPKNKAIDPKTVSQIRSIFKNSNELVVNAHHFVSAFYAFMSFGLQNKVDIFYTEHSEWETKHIKLWWKIIGVLMCQRIKGSIGITPQLEKVLKTNFYIKDTKLHTIVNGVDENKFYPRSGIFRDEMKSTLGISPDTKVVGIVANMRTIKNHIFLLQAFNTIREESDVKLVVVGEGFKFDDDNAEPQIRQYISDNNMGSDVLLLGKRHDIPELLSIMDVFCLVSLKEGLPLSILEAMSSGLPVVGTNVDGISDIVVDEVNGYLVELDDIEGLIHKIGSLLKNEALRVAMGQQARRMANDKYSLTTCAESYLNLFGI